MEINTFTNCKLSDIDKKKDKEVKIAGIVTATETKIAKNGNPYCRFTMEDFDGTYAFSLFGKDYMAFKTYTETNGALLHITGRYQARWDGKEYEFKIMKIDLLSDIRSKLTKHLTLEFDMNDVTDQLTTNLDTLLSKYPGKTKVRINFIDLAEGIKVGMTSSSKAIELSNDLLKELDGMKVGYSLN